MTETDLAAAAKLSTARRIALAIGLPLVLAAVVFTALNLVSLAGRTTVTDDATYPTPAAGVIRIATHGDVTVTGADVPDVQVRRTSSYGLAVPRYREQTTNQGLELAARCRWWNVNCAVSYEVTVPTEMAVDVDTGSGTIRITGASGDVVAHTGSGAIRVENATGKLSLDTGSGSIATDATSNDMTLSTGSGSITATGITSPDVTATTGSGSVSLTFTAAPTAVNARASSGAVLVEVPTGSGPYRVDGTTGSGMRSIDVRTDPNAIATITARTGSGNVTIRETP